MMLALSALAAFNLLCTGVQQHFAGSALEHLNDRGSPFFITYHVDLDRMRWCTEKCEHSSKVASVSETEIKLEDSDTNFGSLISSHHTTVDRETGKFSYAETFGDFHNNISGECKRLPFTGLPERRF